MADQPKHVTYADAGVDVDEGALTVAVALLCLIGVF